MGYWAVDFISRKTATVEVEADSPHEAVDFISRKTATVEVEADSPHEAVELASKDPAAEGMSAEFVTQVEVDVEFDTDEVIGRCEACGAVLLDDDDYLMNDDCCCFCNKPECCGEPSDIGDDDE